MGKLPRGTCGRTNYSAWCPERRWINSVQHCTKLWNRSKALSGDMLWLGYRGCVLQVVKYLTGPNVNVLVKMADTFQVTEY